MGYGLETIRGQLENFSAEKLTALRREWADDKVMTRLIDEELELSHGITPANQFRPSPAQLEALGFPMAYHHTPKSIGYFMPTDLPEREATRMVLWWAASGQYQLRRRPDAQAPWSTVHGAWSTEEDFTGVFTYFFTQSTCPTKSN
jgi:hypothetical protein